MSDTKMDRMFDLAVELLTGDLTREQMLEKAKVLAHTPEEFADLALSAAGVGDPQLRKQLHPVLARTIAVAMKQERVLGRLERAAK